MPKQTLNQTTTTHHASVAPVERQNPLVNDIVVVQVVLGTQTRAHLKHVLTED